MKSDLIIFQLQKADNFITERLSKQRITSRLRECFEKQVAVGAFSNINHIRPTFRVIMRTWRAKRTDVPV